MEMNSPIGIDVLDTDRDGIVGKPLDRVDGRAEGHRRREIRLRGRRRARGALRLRRPGDDRQRADHGDRHDSAREAAPGVVLVLTHEQRPAAGSPSRTAASIRS